MRITLKKRERLDHDGNGGIEFRPSAEQNIPLVASIPVQRVSNKCKRTMRRYRRMRLLAAASGLVVNAIVFHGRAKWFAVPDADRTARLWFEHHLADGLAHEFCDAPPGTRGYLAKRSELFLSQVNLSFFHVCQYMTDMDDVRQIQAGAAHQ